MLFTYLPNKNQQSQDPRWIKVFIHIKDDKFGVMMAHSKECWGERRPVCGIWMFDERKFDVPFPTKSISSNSPYPDEWVMSILHQSVMEAK